MFAPARFDVVLYQEFHNSDFNWFDFSIAARDGAQDPRYRSRPYIWISQPSDGQIRRPRIAQVIPVFNSGKYIEQTIVPFWFRAIPISNTSSLTVVRPMGRSTSFEVRETDFRMDQRASDERGHVRRYQQGLPVAWRDHGLDQRHG